MLMNDGIGRFSPSGSLPAVGGGIATVAVALVDADKDGDLDVFLGNVQSSAASSSSSQMESWSPSSNTLVLNNGAGAGEFRSTDLPFPSGSADATALAFADVDADGDLDLIVANDASQANRLLLNDGSGGFTVSTGFVSKSRTKSVAFGDVDGGAPSALFTPRPRCFTPCTRLAILPVR